ncbi:MAG: acetyl-CoA carboxylase biotin carboxylase subunit [Flavobacteriales bacterium]|nr:acetyl-CoA carboxylase biotin carboxylase subunit [Flavobacteriales bacterium]
MKKILIANRGEIACRIIRSCQEMGIATVAVYSEADRGAKHVKMADEAVFIGPSPASQSYLVQEKIVEAAKKTGADAIHPGYGFLSENASFARLLQKEGIILIGPSAESMEIMGSKLAAKNAVKAYNIPLVPGTDTAINSYEEALAKGKEIGFPILIKASAGGGGKGMRVVREESEFEEALQRAQSEARSAFGDGSVFLEKFIGDSKHIEVQVLCDSHGNYLYLFERECTIQRRHQKVVEEAPSPVINDEKRKQIGEHAVNVARSCNYLGAGTVEFIFDVTDGAYYFLEMNTRLQVEHPVTEMITGVDLVKEQIRIASGEPISFSQSDLKISGHAIEVRVYAEDPSNNFLPDTGKLTEYIIPQGEGIRVDDGFERGMEIPVFYDPMIAKLIVHAENREAAVEKMLHAIQSYHIGGIQTTLGFCRFAVNHEEYRNGKFTTKFVEKYFTPDLLMKEASEEEWIAGCIAASQILEEKTTQPKALESKPSNWKTNRSF